ncbi:hypothetical protein DXO226_05445 [Xanthomonas oryzae pv. oryzae]|nr:hypothetical protein DXO226_05445 [Xanthomonas oryzae pv. oryzae]
MDRITTIARCIVLATSALCVAAYMQPAHAQGMRSATGTATSKYIAPTPQPYNAMARDANARSWDAYYAICNASWPSWNRRCVSASVSGWSAHNGC